MTTRLVDCANGHRATPIPVMYGYPTPEAMADAEEGWVHLGGCDPTFSNERVGDCPVCGAAIASDGRPDGRPAAERQADRSF